jgi:YggT family protein
MRHVIGEVLSALVLVYLILLFARMILGWIVGAADVRPSGVWAAAAEVTWSATDVVVKPLNRVLPAARFGRVVFPLGLLVAIIATYILRGVVLEL